jgi:hypothetical protein
MTVVFLCIELPDDGPYVTETRSVWKYIFVVSTVFWLIIYKYLQSDFLLFFNYELSVAISYRELTRLWTQRMMSLM